MKEEFDKAISTAIETKDIQLFGKLSTELASKYGVSKKTIHNRFHSLFGMGFREYVTDLIQPSKEELISYILNSTSSEEVRILTGLSNRQFTGIYDKNFGVSTYIAAKEKILLEAPTKVRKSSLREDNIAILMSQYLGDGWYDRTRHALRIQHGIKQTEYLRWKVGLIHDGYNNVSQEIKIRDHIQGHQYADWYSGKLGNVDFPENLASCVKLLTPFGWLLFYLDDGTYGQDISISIPDEDVVIEAQKELKTYGIESRINKSSNGAKAFNLTMCGGANSIRFYKVFIEPFLDMIPECMKYKTKVKI